MKRATERGLLGIFAQKRGLRVVERFAAERVVGFGFHGFSLSGCTVKVKVNCGKNLYRTEIVQNVSVR